VLSSSNCLVFFSWLIVENVVVMVLMMCSGRFVLVFVVVVSSLLVLMMVWLSCLVLNSVYMWLLSVSRYSEVIW